jgi:hypothetical protein
METELLARLARNFKSNRSFAAVITIQAGGYEPEFCDSRRKGSM